MTRLERVRAAAPRLLQGPNAVNARTQMLMAGVDLAALYARAGDRRAPTLARQVAAELERSPLVPAALAAPVYADLARTCLDIAASQAAATRPEWLALGGTWLDRSVDLWGRAALTPALEPQRAAALRTAADDRTRAERMARR